MGPMTGRGMGFCAGNDRPGYMIPGPAYGPGYGRGNGPGWGAGRGHGRGFRHRSWYGAAGAQRWGRPVAPGQWAPQQEGPGNAPEAEARMLRDEVEIMEKELEQARRRLQELEKDTQE